MHAINIDSCPFVLLELMSFMTENTVIYVVLLTMKPTAFKIYEKFANKFGSRYVHDMTAQFNSIVIESYKIEVEWNHGEDPSQAIYVPSIIYMNEKNPRRMAHWRAHPIPSVEAFMSGHLDYLRDTYFGKNKLIKTCGVGEDVLKFGKDHPKYGTIPSFRDWWINNVHSEYRDQVQESWETARLRILDQMSAQDESLEKEKKEALIAQAKKDVCNIFKRYRNVPSEELQEAVNTASVEIVVNL